MDENLYRLLTGAGLRDPGRACLLMGPGAISYGELIDGAGRLASLLDAKGLRPGDRLVVAAPKSPEFVLLYLATLQVGAVFVPLNNAYTETELTYYIDDARPALTVTDPIALAREAKHLPPRREITPRAAGDPAAILYTSGTTGRSKGAVLSHEALAANARALCSAWAFTADDVLLHALPVFHVHGLFVALHCALVSGAAMVWLARFHEAEVLEGLARSTVMMGVPTFYTRLLATPDLTREACAGVRLFVSGSAPLLESTFAAFEARTGQRILERYGMSEALIITSNPLVGDRVAGSVGFTLAGGSIRIAGGGVGPIEITGPSVFSEYWEQPEKTAQDFTADGWFITGDVGEIDDDGRLWISGRAKDLIISGGFNIYPKEVELVLDDMPGVIESAVIGVAHPDFGEATVAVIEGAADEQALIAALREKLAAYKLPKRVFRVEALPRNAMGKVQKNRLREVYADTFVLQTDPQ